MADQGRDTSRLDEDDVRVRPNPRGSRPRSKQRPQHEDAAPGMVLTVDRGRYEVLVGADPPNVPVDGASVTAMRARELGRKGIAVGDRVRVVGERTGAEALVRIVSVDERSTVLRRTADDDDPLERVIVANADQLVIVSALADPEPTYGLIDRALVAALTAGLEPLLCLTKSDLAPPDDALERYAALSVPAVVTRRGAPLDELRSRLAEHMSVFVGHSGVGKSTLINALVPDAGRATGVVSAIGKGRHISSSAIALPLPSDDRWGSGWVIDTPGVRSFGLAHVTAEDLLWAFPDLEDGATQCPPGCEHLDEAAGCHLDEWVRTGHATAERLAAFRRLLLSRSAAL
ncbi:MAG TPA: ribosome small subunit-dependent GTPase A [Jatrophihabitantaceae bacterium]